MSQDLQSFIKERFHKDIKSYLYIKPRSGDYAPFPSTLADPLREVLTSQGISQLYHHQLEAFESISRGDNTLLVSSTASGKTLSFFLPILNDYLGTSNPFTTMMLYPTKALSRDQESTFGRLMQAVKKSGQIGTYDGDTPREERDYLSKSADFIITNPDMLHNGILPNQNRKWKVFLSRLKYIVVDEVHTYRGAFGSHVSNVFRRLQRICRIHGSDPIFVCASATIGNPEEHARNLFHREFSVIEKDTAPKAGRHLYLVNPPLQESQGHALYRKGTGSISIPLIREAAHRGVRTIAFCRARQEVERLYRAITDGHPDLKNKVKPYRGGLLPLERRQLEKDLFEGRISCIITTNALELGIDIGDLDLCILSGHPGTMASFWQQAGRVGRKGNEATIVYIAKNLPVDQYLVHHPDFVTQAPIELAWLSADNPYILYQHLPCAAQEHPLRDHEDGFDDRVYSAALDLLKENKTVVPYHDSYRYALQDYPSRGVNLRGMTDYNVEIYAGTEVIGELDPIGARGTLYKDAIYQHLGTRYMSMELDLEKKLCRVDPVNVDYYTEAVWEGRVELTEVDEEKDFHGAQIKFGEIYYNKQPKLYKKIRERSLENIGYGPITLPPFEYTTTGFSLVPPEEWIKTLDAVDKRFLGAALYGISYLLRHVAPSLCMADIQDIETEVSHVEVDGKNYPSSLFLFDTIEGGVGYAEKIYEVLEDTLKMCAELIDTCECDSGCPSCVPPLPPGIDDQELAEFLVVSDAALQCSLSLIHALLYREIRIPQITYVEIESRPAMPEPEIDLEKQKLDRKLNRAARVLDKKREREY